MRLGEVLGAELPKALTLAQLSELCNVCTRPRAHHRFPHDHCPRDGEDRKWDPRATFQPTGYHPRDDRLLGRLMEVEAYLKHGAIMSWIATDDRGDRVGWRGQGEPTMPIHGYRRGPNLAPSYQRALTGEPARNDSGTSLR